MTYKIIIQKKTDNVNYAAEVAKMEENRNYRMSRNDYPIELPQKEVTTDALICELTEEQFKAVKAEVFKAFI